MTEPTTEQGWREHYVKALGEMLATLPPEETVDVIDLGLNTKNRHGLCGQSANWLVTTVTPVGELGLKRTFWRGYLNRDTNTYKLSNVGFIYES